MTVEEQAAMMGRQDIVAMLIAGREFCYKEQSYQSEIKTLKEQLAWYQRQMFGRKSERRVPDMAKAGSLR